MEKKTKVSWKICLLAGIFAVAIVTLVSVIMGYAPFGSNSSLSGIDIDYTQLDTYQYLKDCLTGNDTFGYSFGMGLGGDTANVVAFGMSSPLNLLILFFKQEDYHTYYDILVILNVFLIAFIMSYFLQRRFERKLKPIFVVLLSISYTLSEYVLYHMCNVYWLPGVAFLPLILLGVYEIVRHDKPFLLIFSVLAAIFCGWYTGITDCIFACVWFFFEIFAYKTEDGTLVKFKAGIRKFIEFAAAGCIGAMLSAVMMIPAFAAIKKGNRGTLDWDLFQSSLRNNPLKVISSDILGTVSTREDVTLFVGSLAIIGCIAFFFSHTYRVRQKILVGITLVFAVMCYYWEPLYLIFSMLKQVDSFFCRFSYLGCFTIVFIAALFYKNWDEEPHKSLILSISSVLWISLILVVTLVLVDNQDWKNIALTLAGLALTGIFLAILGEYQAVYLQRAAAVAVALVLTIELAYNTTTITKIYAPTNVQEYKNYVTEQNELVSDIKELDSGYYRIGQSLTRKQGGAWNTTANYCEPWGYNYWGLTSYTNCPDDRQRTMLDHLGYRINGLNMYIVNTSILSTDSLLGLRYFMSPYSINGMNKIDSIQERNSKAVYENPYALPMAFLCEGDGSFFDTASNPFNASEQIYSFLLGEEVHFYTAVDYTETYSEDGMSVSYTLNVPEGNYALYGNLPWGNEYGGIIYKDDEPLAVTAQWCAPSVFYIPSESGENTINIKVQGNSAISITDVQFYALDLDAFQEVTEKLQSEPAQLTVNGSDVDIDVDVTEEKTLFTSFAYDDGWVIEDNGEVITPDLVEDCLMTFRLEPGTHHITLRYQQPGLKAGAAITIFGIILCIIWALLLRKRNLKEKQNGLQEISSGK